MWPAGACERIFKSPVPLVYTRHTSRFLSAFLILLPFSLWPVMQNSWNHWLVVPTSAMIAFFLLGIEEIGMQIEEPFSILPLEALCNGAIKATMDEMVATKRADAFAYTPDESSDTIPALSGDIYGVVKPATGFDEAAATGDWTEWRAKYGAK